MKWLRKILGVSRVLETLENLNKRINEFCSQLKSMDNVNNLNEIKHQIISIKENQNIQSITSLKLIENIESIKEQIIPKPTPITFDIIDPMTQTSIFNFSKIEKNIILKKTLIDPKPNTILQAIGSNIPEFITGGLLAKSFRFQFPEGVVGEVMSIGSGKGTAIMSGGKIIKHGAYLSNLAISAPFILYTIANTIIKHHYLAKINKNLDSINAKLNTLIALEYIKKEAKIESIIYYFNKFYSEHTLIDNNLNYKNSILTTIILKNIEIFELIHFYIKAIESYDFKESDKLNINLTYLLYLQKLYVLGKLLEFKYANEYNSWLVENTIKEFQQINKKYTDFFSNNTKQVEKIIDSNKLNWIDNLWLLGSWIGDKKQKTNDKEKLINSKSFITEYNTQNEKEFLETKSILNEFLYNIEKAQAFLLEEGKLYQLTE